MEFVHRKVESFEEVSGRGGRGWVWEGGREGISCCCVGDPFLDFRGPCRPAPGSKPCLNPRRPWAF